MISIVVPTVKGRESYLEECKASYAAHTEDYELIVVPDQPGCGKAWVLGADRAQGTHIHFSADDLQPHAGWWHAAQEVTDVFGFLPAPRILNKDGTIQSCGGTDCWEVEKPTGEQTDFSRIPFLSREQWDRIRPLVAPILERTHYFTDNAIGYAAAHLSIKTGIHRSFLFTHTLADPGRGAGMSWENRMIHDGRLFEEWAISLYGA